jgi:hypothetical protein
LENRIALTTALLDKLNALPIGELIHFTETGLMLNGKELEEDQVLNFREACVALKENYARKVIFEQVRYKAIDLGINKALSNDTLYFSKAAIWSLNEIEVLIQKLLTLQ